MHFQISHAAFLGKSDHPLWKSLQMSFYHYWDGVIFWGCLDRKKKPKALGFEFDSLYNFSLFFCPWCPIVYDPQAKEIKAKNEIKTTY